VSAPIPVRYALGDSGPAVAEIRGRLIRLDLLAAAGPARLSDSRSADRFDADVEQAVRTFQQRQGLVCDGIVGAQTWRRLEEARWNLGDRVLLHSVSHPLSGDDVAALQDRLLELGFDPGRVDGIFGTTTDQALRDFQRNVGLADDGTCGPATFKALARLARTVVGGAPHTMREQERIHSAGPGLAGKVVVIDAGHGGLDHGITGHGLSESLVAEDLAARIEGRLAAVGARAYLTRGRLGDDESPPDEDSRARFANQTAADLVVSLHVDGHPNPHAQGIATFYYGTTDGAARSPMGATFARLVQREITARTDLVDCGVDAKTWDLLRRTRMPAVRIEVGYLTNAHDADRLREPTFRDVVAEAVAVAVQRLYLPPDTDAPTGVLRLPALDAAPASSLR
jgi:N-acetylmuramoyl-L-alanine amidase